MFCDQRLSSWRPLSGGTEGLFLAYGGHCSMQRHLVFYVLLSFLSTATQIRPRECTLFHRFKVGSSDEVL